MRPDSWTWSTLLNATLALQPRRTTETRSAARIPNRSAGERFRHATVLIADPLVLDGVEESIQPGSEGDPSEARSVPTRSSLDDRLRRGSGAGRVTELPPDPSASARPANARVDGKPLSSLTRSCSLSGSVSRLNTVVW